MAGNTVNGAHVSETIAIATVVHTYIMSVLIFFSLNVHTRN
jgi:hypothetical protein